MQNKIINGLRITVLLLLFSQNFYIISTTIVANESNVKTIEKPKEVINIKSEEFKEIERIDLRTPYSKVFQTGKSTFRSEVNIDKIHYGTQGDLKDINNNIIEEDIEKFKYRNASNDFTFRAGNTINEGVQYKKGNQVCEFKLNSISNVDSLNNSKAVINNNIITYPNIYPAADLEFTVLPTGIKTEIVAKDKSALKSEFEFELINCDPKIFDKPIISNETKSLEIKQEIRNKEFISRGKRTKSRTLNLKPDYSKLGEIKGEVRIDPSILQPAENVFVSQFCTGHSRRFIATGDWTDSVGPYVCGRAEAYLKFNMSIPSGAIISNAELSLQRYQTDYGGFNVSVGRLTTNSLNTSTGSVLSDFKPKTGAYTTKYLNQGNYITQGFYDFRLDMKTLVTEWVNGTNPNYGLALFGDSPAGSWRGAAFCSTRSDGFCNSTQNPKLIVDYFINNPPNTPNNPSPANGTKFSGNCDESVSPSNGTCRTQLNVTTSVSNVGDPNIAPGDLQKTNFIYTEANNFTSPDINGSGTVSYSQNFNEGVTRWGARSYDKMGASSGFAGFYDFTIDTTPSSVPGIDQLPQYTKSVNINDPLQVQVTSQAANDNISPQNQISYSLQYSKNSNFSGAVFSTNWQLNNSTINLGPKGVDGIAGSPDDLVPYNTYYFRIKSKDSLNNISGWSSTVQTTIYDNNPPYTPNLVSPLNSSNFSGNCDESQFPALGSCKSNRNINFSLSGTGDGDLPPGDFDKTFIDFFQNGNLVRYSDPIYATGDANWNGDFGDGNYNWKAHSVDKLGVWGNFSPEFTFSVDTTPPQIPTAPSMPEFTPGVGIDSNIQIEFFGNKTTDNVSSQNDISYELQYSTSLDFSSNVFTKSWQRDNSKFEIGPKGLDGTLGTADDIKDGNTYYFRVKAKDALNNISAWNSKDINGNALKTTIDGVKPVIVSFSSTEERFSPNNSTSTGYKDIAKFDLTYTEKYPKTALINIYSSNDSNRTSPLKTITQDLNIDKGTSTGIADQYSLSLSWDGKDNSSNYLGDGAYVVVSSVIDKATNEIKSSELPVIIDNSPANITISSPLQNFWTNKNDLNITGQATAPNLPNAEDGDLQYVHIKRLISTSWKLINLNDPSLPENDPNLGIFNIKPGNPISDIYPLNLGKNTFEIRSTDTVGNQESVSHSINYETTEPEISNILPNALTNNKRPKIVYKVNDFDPTNDGTQRSDLRVGINPVNTKIWLTYETYNPNTNTYVTQNKILIDNGVNLDSALISDLTCTPTIGAQIAVKNGVNVANSINCSLSFVSDLQPDSTYTIHIGTKDIAENGTLKEDVSFVLDSHIYSELALPANGSTYSTSSVKFKGKSSKNSFITLKNQQLGREKTFKLDENLNNTGIDDLNDPNRLIASNFVVICGEFKDIDERSDTKDEELCNWEVKILQKYQNTDIDTLNTNIITLKDEAGNSVVHTLEFNVNLYGFDLEVASDLNYFSPNGDGNQDNIKFTHTAVNPTNPNFPPEISSYKLQLKNNSGVIIREFNGTNNLPGDTFWDGKVCQIVDLHPSDATCTYIADGEYKFNLIVTTTDFITISTEPQSIFVKTVLLDEVVITNPKNGHVTTNGVISLQGQAPKPQNTEGTVNPLRGRVYVDICIDTLTTAESCDISTTVETDANGFFSSLVILPRLPQSQTLHNINASARDDFGNITKKSNTVQIIQDTLDPFKSISITPVLTGINTVEDYQKFLNGEISIDKLRVLKLNAQLTQNTEQLQYSFAKYININQRPNSPSFNYIATINDTREDKVSLNPYDLNTIKKNFNKSLGDPNIPVANCNTNTCVWEYYLPSEPNWGGIYEVEFKAKKGEKIQSLTAGFKVDGNIPAAPIIMIVDRWDENTDRWVTLTPYEAKYYTNKTKIRLRGAAEPNINLQLSINNAQLESFKSSTLGIWEKEIDYETLLNNFCKEYENNLCGLADLDITLKAFKTDSNENITYEIPSVNNAFIRYDSIAPKATSITRVTPTNTILGWVRPGMNVQYSLNANEILSYSDLVKEDGFVRLLKNSSNNLWIGDINIDRQEEGYYKPRMRLLDLAGNITSYNSSDPIFLESNSVIKDWRVYIDSTNPESSVIEKTGWGVDNGIKADGILPEFGRLNPEYVVSSDRVTIKGKAEKDQRIEIFINNSLNTIINVGDNNCAEVGSYNKKITNDNLLVKDNILCKYLYEYIFPKDGMDELFGAPKESYIFQIRVLDKATNYSTMSKQEIVYHDKKQPLQPQILTVNVKPITQELKFNVSIRSERFADIEYWLVDPKGGQKEYRLIQNNSLGLLTQNFNLGNRRDDSDPNCMVMIGLRKTGVCEDGIYTLLIKATDAAGNTTEFTTLKIERDTVAPSVPEIVSTNRTSPTKEINITIKTLAEERATINYQNSFLSNIILRNINSYREFLNSDNGYFDQLFNLGILKDEGRGLCVQTLDSKRIGICDDGQYFFNLTATDAAGNTSDTARTSIERDTTNPMQPKVTSESAKDITKELKYSVNTQTEKNSLTTFTFAPPQTSKQKSDVRVEKRNSIDITQEYNLGTKRDDSEGNCKSLVGNRSIGICEDAIYNLLIQSIDTAGNIAPETSLKLERDTVVPNKPKVELLVNKSSRKLNARITGEANTKVFIKLLSSKINKNYEFTIDQSGVLVINDLVGTYLAKTKYTLEATLIDNAKNISDSGFHSVTTPEDGFCIGGSGNVLYHPLRGNYIPSGGGGFYSERFYGAHGAQDFTYATNSFDKPVYASEGGEVINSDVGNFWYDIPARDQYSDANPNGRMPTATAITVRHANKGLITEYLHLNQNLVQRAEQSLVYAGQQIGSLGNTGYVEPRPKYKGDSSGAHLHFAVGLINPKSYTNYDKTSVFGVVYIDPMAVLGVECQGKEGLGSGHDDVTKIYKQADEQVAGKSIDERINIYPKVEGKSETLSCNLNGTKIWYKKIERISLEGYDFSKEPTGRYNVPSLDDEKDIYNILAIYNPDDGRTFLVRGWMKDALDSVGGVCSTKLGLPTSEEEKANPSKFGTVGEHQWFDNGSIYNSWKTNGYLKRAIPVYGNVSMVYEGNGGTSSWSAYGFPDTDVYDSHCGGKQNFEGEDINLCRDIEEDIDVDESKSEHARDRYKDGVDLNNVHVNLKIVPNDNPTFRQNIDYELSKRSYMQGKDVWIVSHGFTGSFSGNLEEIAKEIKREYPDAIVMGLDWSDPAYGKSPPGLSVDNCRAATWIKPVSEAAEKRLREWGFNDGTRLHLVGHSLGAIMSVELAKRYGYVDTVIGLDPAEDFNCQIHQVYRAGGYLVQLNPKVGKDDFTGLARFSRAFVGKGSVGGDEAFAQSAQQSFYMYFKGFKENIPIVNGQHSWVVNSFKGIIREVKLQKDETGTNVMSINDRRTHENWQKEHKAECYNEVYGYIDCTLNSFGGHYGQLEVHEKKNIQFLDVYINDEPYRYKKQ